MTEKILLEKRPEDHAAIITINRPEKRNAIDKDVIDGYLEALEDARLDDDVYVVHTRAAGPSFCSGMDLNYLKQYRSENKPVWDWGNMASPGRMVTPLFDYPKVLVGSVRGYALGGGFSLALAQDVLVVADDAQLGMPEVLRGSFGQGVTAQIFKEGIPRKKAILLQLLGRNLTGVEAADIGIATYSVPDAEVESTADQIVTELGSRNPTVLAHGKIAAAIDIEMPLRKAFQSDDMVAARMRQTIDPLGDVSGYLASQKGGTNTGYVRPE